MSWCYRHLIRPFLFTQDPEDIHGQTLRALSWVSQSGVLREFVQSFYGAPNLPVSLWGLNFPNPIGLAAGMDKYAEALPAWESLGFGFTELGSVTGERQPGNPPPRVFRAVAEQALVNRMGFNNPGADALAQCLGRWRSSDSWPGHPVGVNLGKSRITPLESAAEDYAKSFQRLHGLADFFVVNVSSPNTPGLRKLQEKSALEDILAALQEVNLRLTPSSSPGPSDAAPPPDQNAKPILVKVAPDLTWEALDDILDLVTARQLSGVVATNTTLTRPSTADSDCEMAYAETGGLSGRPLRDRSTEVIRYLYRQTNGRLPIIGVGGIFNAAHAWEKIRAGASLVQVYTGLVYEGPALLNDIVQGLQQCLTLHGLRHLREAVGLDA